MIFFSRSAGRSIAIAVAFAVWPFFLLAMSNFDLVPLRTSRVTLADGDALVETRYHPLGVFGLLIPAVAVVSGVALLLVSRIHRLTDESARQNAALRAKLARELGLVREHLAANESYGRFLANAQQRLSGLSEVDQVRLIVALLLAENQRMQRSSVEYKKRIEDCTREIETLRVSLSWAEEEALTDPLTGIGNRRKFDVVLAEAIRASEDGRSPLSLIICDIDHFKAVNDAFGHRIGDEVIKTFARMLVTSVRDADTVTRYGGEEFAIILPGTDEAAAASIAERMRVQLEIKKLTIRQTKREVGRLTASFGVAERRQDDGVEALVHRTDGQLYKAKAAGRNRVERARTSKSGNSP